MISHMDPWFIAFVIAFVVLAGTFGWAVGLKRRALEAETTEDVELADENAKLRAELEKVSFEIKELNHRLTRIKELA